MRATSVKFHALSGVSTTANGSIFSSEKRDQFISNVKLKFDYFSSLLFFFI